MTDKSADTLLQNFRNKVTRNMVWAGAVTLLGLTGAQLWLTHYLQAAVMFTAAIVFAAIAYTFRAQRIPNYWRLLFMVLLTAICAMSIKQNGVVDRNSSFGHLFGDQMLKQLAKRLKQRLRVNDQLFRVGGEKFLVVLPETDLSEAEKVAQKLLSTVADEPFDGKDVQVHLTVSIGVVQLRAEQSWAEWINSADTALLEAKRKGRNQVCVAEGYTEI